MSASTQVSTTAPPLRELAKWVVGVVDVIDGGVHRRQSGAALGALEAVVVGAVAEQLACRYPTVGMGL